MSILDLLGFGGDRREVSEPQADTETVRKIVSKLNDLPRARARFVASFAYILGRVAHADSDISDGETRAMERIVCKHGHLPEEQAVIVVQIAKTQNLLFGGTENFLVTREFSDLATREEKLALLECLFAVSAADDTVSTVEDNAIRQVADELKLDHSDFIAARSKFRDYLGVLRKPE